jgi:hypothetical protein
MNPEDVAAIVDAIRDSAVIISITIVFTRIIAAGISKDRK